MEKRLTDFIAASEAIADMRNLDPRNPIFIKVQHPVLSIEYIVVCSILEPSYIGVPMNVTWIVLDPKSPYFRRALKLREDSWTPPADVNPVNIEVAEGTNGKWYLVREYAEIFADHQYYLGSKGERGDQGPKGDRGDQGPEGVVDYDRLAKMIQDILNAQADLAFVNPTLTVFGTKTASYATELVKRVDGSKQSVTATFTINTDKATFSGSTLTVSDLAQDVSAVITAKYKDADSGIEYVKTQPVSLKALRPQSLTVNGPSTVNETQTGQYSASVRWTDGTTKTPVAGSLVWSADAALGTINTAGLLATPDVSANASGKVTAAYTDPTYGTAISGFMNVTVVDAGIKPFYGVAAMPADGLNGIAALVPTLSNRGPNASKVIPDIALCQAAGQYLWCAYPKAYGLATFTDKTNNFPGGWDGANSPVNGAGSYTGPKEVSITINGQVVPFYVYRTDYAGLGCPPENNWSVA